MSFTMVLRYFLYTIAAMVTMAAIGCGPPLDVPLAQELMQRAVGADSAPLYCSTPLEVRLNKPITWYEEDVSRTDLWLPCITTLKEHDMARITRPRNDAQSMPYADIGPIKIESIAGRSAFRDDHLVLVCGSRSFKVTKVERDGDAAIIHYFVEGNVSVEAMRQIRTCAPIANLMRPMNAQTRARLIDGRWQLLDTDVLKP